MTDDLLRGSDVTETHSDDAAAAEATVVENGAEGSAAVVGQAGETVTITRPAPGQTVEIQAAAGQTYVLSFPPGQAQVQVQGENFILSFDDNGDGTPDSQVVFLDLVTVAQSSEGPAFQIAGVDIDSEVLLNQALALAGQDDVPLDDVAAGPGGLGGGATAYSDNLGSILDLLVAQGVIPPVVLEFGLIDVEDRITILDEAEGEIDITFRTETDGGEGGVQTWEGGFEDWLPNQDDCDTEQAPMQVIIGFTPADNEELVSLVISGIPDGAKLFVGGIEVPVTDGESPVLTPADLASGLHLLPPEDSGDDIPLTVTATISDPDSGDTSVISGSATAVIDSVADNPSALFDGEIADGGEGCSPEGGEGGAGASDAEIEDFLGLAPGALDDASAYGSSYGGDATDGSAIKTTLELQAGDHVELTYNFLDAEANGDGPDFQDFAFITINGQVFFLNGVDAANDPTSAQFTVNGITFTWEEESGYITLSGSVETGGSYEIGIGVMNEDDTSVDSGLLLDDLIVTRGEEVVFHDEFTSFDNWEIVGGGFAAIVGDIGTNEDMPGAPTQGLLIAAGPVDPSACGCKVIVSSVTYNEDNASHGDCEEDDQLPPPSVQSQGEGEGGDCDDCGPDQQPIFGAGFVAKVNDIDGSESLTKITIATTTELEPGYDDEGLAAALSGVDDQTATNFMVGDQVLVHGETVEVVATFADGSTGLATAEIDITDGVLTLTFAPELRVQSVDLSGGSDTPFQVRLPQHSDDDFQLNLEVTVKEHLVDGELTLDNNEATHQAVLNVEVKAVADGAGLTGAVEGEGFAEDDESDPANHGEDSGETGLVIPLGSLSAALIDTDGSEAITQIKIHLEGADEGAELVDAEGNPLGETLQITVGETVITADVSTSGGCLILSFDGCETAGLDIDLSGLIAVKLPVDDSDDFTVHVAATTSEVKPEGEVACETKTTETSFEVHVGGVAGPAAIEFGSYDNFPGCGCHSQQVDGNTLTLSVFEDNQSSVAGQEGAGPLVVPVFFTAATQDSDGSEKITKVVLSLDGAPEGSAFTDGLGEPLTAGQEIAGGTASFHDGQLVITFPGDGADPIDLSGIGVKLPLHSDDDFSIKIVTTTKEYDDDGEDALVATHETDAFINVKVDAVADPVTVTVDAESANGDEAFAPGEAGTVKVTATFADLDGSEAHTVTLRVPTGFTVLDTDGGVQDGDTITWTVSGQADFEANLAVKANDDLTEDETVKWKAKAKAVEQNTNTDPSLGDAECTTGNNTAVDFDKDKVTLDPALPPEVAVRIQGDALCIEEDGEGQFAVKVDALGDDFITQIKVENLPTGWGVSITGSDAGDGGSFNPGTGIYTTGGSPVSVTLTVVLTPPADSDLDVATVMGGNDITFTATAEDPQSGDTAESAPVVVDVNVDAVADAVNVTVDAESATGDEAFLPGEAGTVTVDASFGDAADGSEVHTVVLKIPAGFTVTDPVGGTVDEEAGTITWTVTGTGFHAVIGVLAGAGFSVEDGMKWIAEAKAEEQNENTDPAQGDVECTLGNNVEEDSAEEAVVALPGIAIDKVVSSLADSGDAADEAGDVINYQITVSNTGNQTLTNVVVADPEADTLVRGTDLAGDNDDELEVGEVWSYTATRTVTQADIDGYGGGDGDIDNTATADSDETEQVEDSAEVPVEQSPSLNVTKVADVQSVDAAGDVITYTIKVENTGNVTLTGVDIDDPLTGDEAPVLVDGFNAGDLDKDGKLDVDETWEYSASYTVTQEDLDSGEAIDNTVTADSSETGPDTADETVEVEQNPGMTIEKVVASIQDGGAVVDEAGDVINYIITVSNTGNVTLTNVSVDDPLTLNETYVSGDTDGDNELDVGETWVYEASYTVSQADFNNNGGGDGFIDNTATATSDQTDPMDDSASVEIVNKPVLVVGDNVCDIDGETEPHVVDTSGGPGYGVIAGESAGDVLIGDVGGSDLTGKVMNIALVLDTSGSMTNEITFDGETMTRVEALDQAVEDLLDSLANTTGATVRVFMVSFATDVKETAAFDIVVDGVVDPVALQAAKDFILDEGYDDVFNDVNGGGMFGNQPNGIDDDIEAVADGFTNYEAGFTEALDWFSNAGNTLDNPDFNQTVFISDGAPNRAYEGDTTNDVRSFADDEAIEHVLGTYPGQADGPGPGDSSHDPDIISEYDGLLGSFEGVAGMVDSIGINVSNDADDNLDLLDDDDNADNISTGEQLLDVLGDITQVNTLADVGCDSIVGGNGADLVFGDTLFTDLLADDQGVNLPPGSGWAVIQYLVNNTSFFDAFEGDTIEEQIMSFLRDPANQADYELFRESLDSEGEGRGGGQDTIEGGAGNDTIYGQEGDDSIVGGSGQDVITGGTGEDTMTGGTERDTFRWTAADHGTVTGGGGSVQTVYNFAGVTQTTNNHFAWELEIETSGNPESDGDWNGPLAHDDLEVISELGNGDYEDVDTDDGDRFETLSPTNDGDVAAFVAQFTVAENISDITQIDLVINANQEGGNPDAPAYFAVWNYSTGNWEVLETFEQDQNSDHNYTGTISGDFDDYLGGSGNDQISIMLLNGDDEDWLRIDYVEVEVTSNNPVVADPDTDTITDFKFVDGVDQPDEDVLDLSDLLQGVVDGNSAAELAGYLHVSYDSISNTTTIEVDHDGATGGFQPSLNIVLENCDLTAGGTYTTDQQIIQAMLDGNNLTA